MDVVEEKGPFTERSSSRRSAKRAVWMTVRSRAVEKVVRDEKVRRSRRYDEDDRRCRCLTPIDQKVYPRKPFEMDIDPSTTWILGTKETKEEATVVAGTIDATGDEARKVV